MGEILNKIDVHNESIPYFGYSYKIEISLIKEVDHYNRKENVQYYNEYCQLIIQKITKRHWIKGDKKEILYQTKLSTGKKDDILNFAYEYINRIEKSIYN